MNEIEIIQKNFDNIDDTFDRVAKILDELINAGTRLELRIKSLEEKFK